MITLGLLQCDDIAEQLQPEHGNYPAMFQRMFDQLDECIELRIYDVRKGEYPSDLDECAGYLTTGSQHGLGDGLPWVERLLEFIRKLDGTNTAFFGICFGHQAMACALGGAVEVSPNGWGVGVSQNKIIKRTSWMDPELNRLNVIVSHQDQIVRLPANAVVLAESEFCPYYLIQIGNSLASVQGHPEFTSQYSKALMNARRNIIPADRITAGMNSLEQEPIDSLTLSKWIVRFLTGRNNTA